MQLNTANIFAQGGTTGPLTWSFIGGTLTISGTGAMPDYGSVPWEAYKKQTTNLVIGSGVSSIGNYAFSGCSSLSNVNLPNSITSIGSSAFNNCSNLTTIALPDGLIKIGSYAFNP